MNNRAFVVAITAIMALIAIFWVANRQVAHGAGDAPTAQIFEIENSYKPTQNLVVVGTRDAPGGPRCQMVTVRSTETMINWACAEKATANPNIDPMALVIARLIIAVRDGTWKALDEVQPAR